MIIRTYPFPLNLTPVQPKAYRSFALASLLSGLSSLSRGSILLSCSIHPDIPQPDQEFLELLLVGFYALGYSSTKWTFDLTYVP